MKHLIAVVVVLVARVALGAVEPVVWLSIQTAEGPANAERAESLMGLVPGKDSPAQWLPCVLTTAASVAQHEGGRLAVLRWPDMGLTTGASYVVAVPRRAEDESQTRDRVEAAAGGPAPPSTVLHSGGQAWAWRVDSGMVIIASGDDPVLMLSIPTAPGSDEFKVHLAKAEPTAPARRAASTLFLDLNAMRRQAPTRFATGPEGRLLEQLHIANARALGIACIARATPVDGPLAGRDLLTFTITWSARSQPPGTVGVLSVGESAWPARDAPPVPPGLGWVFAMRTDAGAGPFSMGWGGLIRQSAALCAALVPTRAESEERTDKQQRWFMAQSTSLREMTSRLDRYLVVTTMDGEPYSRLCVWFPVRPTAPEASAPLVGAARQLLEPLPGVAIDVADQEEGKSLARVTTPSGESADVMLIPGPVRVVEVRVPVTAWAYVLFAKPAK